MRAVKQGGEIRIEDGYLHKESIKEIPGRRYDTDSKAWYTPCTEKNAVLLQTLGAKLDEELRAFVSSVCGDAAVEVPPIRAMPIKVTPYKHQVRAFNFALKILCGEGGDANDI